VSLQDMGIIVSAPYPTLLKLASSVPYAPGTVFEDLPVHICLL